jgi:hypothetical protein
MRLLLTRPETGLPNHPHPLKSTDMKHLNALTFALVALTASQAASAHEGHGLPGISHWHGTDVLGFVGVVAVMAAVWWLGGRK